MDIENIMIVLWNIFWKVAFVFCCILSVLHILKINYNLLVVIQLTTCGNNIETSFPTVINAITRLTASLLTSNLGLHSSSKISRISPFLVEELKNLESFPFFPFFLLFDMIVYRLSILRRFWYGASVATNFDIYWLTMLRAWTRMENPTVPKPRTHNDILYEKRIVLCIYVLIVIYVHLLVNRHTPSMKHYWT